MTQSVRDHHALSVAESLRILGTSRSGLSLAEAEVRLKRFGPNELPAPRSTPLFRIFFRQIASPLLALLVAAAVVSLFSGKGNDAFLIFVTIAITVVFGFFQEAKAERSLTALRQAIRSTARVVREGKELAVSTDTVVPGDTVIFSAGDRLPADIRLIEASDLATDESFLSGESMPSGKRVNELPAATPLTERSNIVYAGTAVASGEGEGVVFGTGLNTEIGKIADALRVIKDEPSMLSGQISRLALTITSMVGLAGSLIFVVGWWRGQPFVDMLVLSVATIVAAIPEGLAVSVTVIMAIGMIQLHKANALVRRLSSAESLGSVSVICFDKTGTLTEGKMSMVEIVGDKKRAAELIVAGVSARVANIHEPEKDWRVSGESTEAALLAGALKTVAAEEYRRKVVVEDLPFSSERGYRATITKTTDGYRLTVIGQPELLLEASKQKNASAPDEWRKEIVRLAGNGVRVLGIATKETDAPFDLFDRKKPLPSLEFVALVGLSDPLRSNAKRTVARIHSAGIRVVMITGDNPLTATAIAREVGIIGRDGDSIAWSVIEHLPEGEFISALKQYQVFARVPPSEKLKIVTALQDVGETVAMTGDGVNDAPALKRASIGVVMGGGTDVAKETGDLILLDDNLETIVTAIGGGRRIFDNIRKVAIFLLVDSFQEMALIAATIAMGWPLPLLPAQILWVNLIEDTLPSFALAFEPQESRVMQEPPRRRSDGILDKRSRLFLILGGTFSAVLFVVFVALLFAVETDLSHIRTMTFVALGIDSMFVVFSLRRLRRSAFFSNPFENLWVVAAVAAGMILYAIAIYFPPLAHLFGNAPLGWYDWLKLCAFGAGQLVIFDLIKIQLFVNNKYALSRVV